MINIFYPRLQQRGMRSWARRRRTLKICKGNKIEQHFLSKFDIVYTYAVIFLYFVKINKYVSDIDKI